MRALLDSGASYSVVYEGYHRHIRKCMLPAVMFVIQKVVDKNDVQPIGKSFLRISLNLQLN